MIIIPKDGISPADKAKLDALVVGNLGWYATEALLNAAHASAVNGNFAIVGSTDTVWVWDGDTNAWVNTGVASTGDMMKAIYDPTNINDDAFDRENHTGQEQTDDIADNAITTAKDANREATAETGSFLDMIPFTTAPTAPQDGDMWLRNEGGSLYLEYRIGGVTKGVVLG